MPLSGWILSWFVGIGFTAVFILTVSQLFYPSEHIEMTGNPIWGAILTGIIGCFMFLGGLKGITTMRNQRVIGKILKNGGGVVKQMEVTGFRNGISGRGYYVEVKDGGKIYCSDTYSEGEIFGTSIEELEGIYKKYGFQFDKKETNKQGVLKEIDKRIALGSLNREYYLGTYKYHRKEVEKGYQPEYWEVNGHRITIGDKVNVYVDPEDDKNYKVDIDFLFEK